VTLLLALLLSATPADYEAVLKAAVRTDGVDYAALRGERERLLRWAKWLEEADPGATDAEKLAFWINAYNGLTLVRVLETIPEQGPYRVIDVKEFWKGRTFRAARRKVTLDDIEHAILRKEWKEPRIHFAINCASRSCPPLLATPYAAASLDRALDAQARAYLADASQNTFDPKARRARVSQLFEWFRGDFGDLPRFLARYAPEAAAKSLAEERWTIEFRPYDWSLNEAGRPRHAKGSLEGLLLPLFLLAALCLVGYGVHAILLLRARRRRGAAYLAGLEARAAASPAGRSEFPRVLVQLPIYDEPEVAERAVAAVAALDWPRDRLEIQVLDDSDDGTRAIVDRAAERARARGAPLSVLRRERRDGFKAGALDAGLRVSAAEYVAIFDADFEPAPDFLRRALPLFGEEARTAVVQGRWEHSNRERNWLTRAQAVAVDAHFLVEQLARAATGKFLNFSGTAGVWRRAAIDDAGGWRGDTLTEDLDLSYRAQLRGWRIVFHPGLAVPAELPATLSAYKSQQRRWACGSMQCARKHLGAVWRAPLPLPVKFEATAHLCGYGACVAMILVALLVPLGLGPLPLLRRLPSLAPLWLALWIAATGPFALAAAGQRARGRARPLEVLACFLLAVGGSANVCLAAMRGLFRPIREFVRTPKLGARAAAERGPAPRLEPAMGLLTLAFLALLWRGHPWAAIPYGLFCSAGFLSVALYGWLGGRNRKSAG